MALRIVKGKVLPIGVDLGSSALKLAQLREVEGAYELTAAAAVDVPDDCQEDLQARMQFYGSQIRRLVREGQFRGRTCILSAPTEATFVQHVKIPKMPPAQVPHALLQELRGKLPFPLSEAEVRHIVAGDVAGERVPASTGASCSPDGPWPSA